MLAPAGRLPGDFTGLPFGAVSSMEGFRNDARVFQAASVSLGSGRRPTCRIPVTRARQND
ncbi:hypothetical protein BDZ89DRAFT_1080033 [Hymenopellis radicata]|nr:hypothetical protein BDZ89DRAFT_1080033 [Hymenopellis radicata]